MNINRKIYDALHIISPDKPQGLSEEKEREYEGIITDLRDTNMLDRYCLTFPLPSTFEEWEKKLNSITDEMIDEFRKVRDITDGLRNIYHALQLVEDSSLEDMLRPEEVRNRKTVIQSMKDKGIFEECSSTIPLPSTFDEWMDKVDRMTKSGQLPDYGVS